MTLVPPSSGPPGGTRWCTTSALFDEMHSPPALQCSLAFGLGEVSSWAEADGSENNKTAIFSGLSERGRGLPRCKAGSSAINISRRARDGATRISMFRNAASNPMC